MLLLYLKTKTKFLTNLQSILVNSAILNLIFSLNIFSLAGIPPFGGFFVKFDILINLILSSNYIIGFFLLLITVINFFYYLRLIKIIYFENNNFKVIYNIIDTLKLLLIIFIIYLVCGFELFMQHSFLFIIDKIFLSIL
jgi:NADH:ubiquinone oxidoreductase subunit 2 (subunit N)